MTRQLATIANYVNGSYVPVPYEDSGTPDYGPHPPLLCLQPAKCRRLVQSSSSARGLTSVFMRLWLLRKP